MPGDARAPRHEAYPRGVGGVLRILEIALNAHYGHPNCTRSHWQSEFATPERMLAGLVYGAPYVPCTCPQPSPVKPDAVDAPGPDCSRCGRPQAAGMAAGGCHPHTFVFPEKSPPDEKVVTLFPQ